MGGACSANGGELDGVYVIGKRARGNKSLGRPRRRWVDNIKMDFVQI
jgi:hypothetical protein